MPMNRKMVKSVTVHICNCEVTKETGSIFSSLERVLRHVMWKQLAEKYLFMFFLKYSDLYRVHKCKCSGYMIKNPEQFNVETLGTEGEQGEMNLSVCTYCIVLYVYHF